MSFLSSLGNVAKFGSTGSNLLSTDPMTGGGGNILTGQPDAYKQLPTKTPQQQNVLSQYANQFNQLGGAGGNLERATSILGNILSGDEGTFNKFAAPYMQQFEQQLVPQLAERFAGLGGAHGGGALQSSGFAQALGGAGANLQSTLANLFANLQRGTANDVFGQYNQLAQTALGASPFENIRERGNTGVLGGLASGLSEGAGKKGGQEIMEFIINLLGQLGKP